MKFFNSEKYQAYNNISKKSFIILNNNHSPILWKLDFLLNSRVYSVQKTVTGYQQRKRDLATELKMKIKNPKKINILRTRINYYRKRLVSHQAADFNTLYQYRSGAPFVWELDFLLCNEYSCVQKVIENYKEKSILLSSCELDPNRDSKKINILKTNLNRCRIKLKNYQLNIGYIGSNFYKNNN